MNKSDTTTTGNTTGDKNTSPSWWDMDYQSAWERVSTAFARDWDETARHFGADNPVTGQDALDTLKQAAGSTEAPPRGAPAFEEVEAGYKYGYGSRMKHGATATDWDDSVESKVKADWESESPQHPQAWESQRDAVKRGWDYKNDHNNDPRNA